MGGWVPGVWGGAVVVRPWVGTRGTGPGTSVWLYFPLFGCNSRCLAGFGWFWLVLAVIPAVWLVLAVLAVIPTVWLGLAVVPTVWLGLATLAHCLATLASLVSKLASLATRLGLRLWRFRRSMDSCS